MKKLFDKIFKRKKEKKGFFLFRKDNFNLIEMALIVAIACFIGVFGGTVLTYCAMKDIQSLNDGMVVETDDFGQVKDIYDSIIDNYYKPVEKDTLINAAIQGMITSLGDPYAILMNADEKNVFDERMKGEYYGIGVELLNDQDNNIVIVNVFSDTPAEKAGLRIGDIIVALNGKNLTGVKSAELATSIKSSSAVSFNLQIKREDKDLSITVAKRKIELKSVTKNVYQNNHKKVGYINVSIFAENTYDQFKTALLSLEAQKVDSLIIDVRNNSGGFLYTAEEMLNLFFKKNTTIYQLQTKEDTEIKYDSTNESRTYPISVLINKNSASASEILAAAFKDSYGSAIIGTTSYGKGTVQQTRDLKAGTMIKFTTQKWLTPKGTWIEGKGIEPTISVEQSDKFMLDPTFANDTQLNKAIDEITK